MTTYNDTLSETILATHNIQNPGIYSFLGSSLISSDSISVKNRLYISMVELVETLSVISNTSILYDSITSLISILDTLEVLYKENLTSTITASDSTDKILTVKLEIEDIILKNSNVTSFSTFKNTLNSIISIIDVLEKAIASDIIESITVSDSIDTLYTLLNATIDPINITENLNENIIYLIGLSESFQIDMDQYSNIYASSDINAILVLKVGDNLNSKFTSYLLSPESMSVSTYSNYNFTCSCKFDDKYLFGNSTGLYEYGGITDDGATIRAEMETVAYNFDTSNLKQVPYLYLGVDSTDNFILKVRVDGKGEILYKLNKYTNNLMTQKVDIGKGLIGRYFQFEIITEADEFNLESIEYCPLIIRRKI